MFKKLFCGAALVFFLLLTSATSVMAIPTDALSYWNFNGDALDSWGTWDLTVNSGSYPTSYPAYNITGNGSTNSLEFDGTNTYAEVAQNFDLDTDTTIAFWFYNDGNTGYATLIDNANIAGNYEGIRMRFPAANEFQVFMYQDGSDSESTSNVAISTAIWTHIAWTYEVSSKDVVVYKNGAVADSMTLAKVIKTSTNNIDLGQQNDDNLRIDGKLDEFKIFDKELNLTEVQNLYKYNSVLGENVTPPASATTINITASNIWGNSAIGNFTVIINATGYNKEFNTTNGTINTDINGTTGLIYNISFIAYDPFDSVGGYCFYSNPPNRANPSYYNITYSEVNVSLNYEGLLHNSELYLTASEILTENALTGNYTINTTTETSSFSIDAGTYNVTFRNESYLDKIQEFSVCAMQNNNVEIVNISNTRLNITAYDLTTATYITNFNITISNLNRTYNVTETISNGEFSKYLLANDTYFFSIDATGFELANTTYRLPLTTANYTFNLYTTNSINFTFRDSITGALINTENLTIDFIGTVAAYNYTTDTGYLYVDLITPSIYTLRYYGNANYTQNNHYIFQMTNRTHNNLTLYLSKEPFNVTVTVYDSNTLEKVEGAYVYVLRYDKDVFEYLNIAMGETLFGGTMSFSSDQNEYHKLQVAYPLGTTRLTTEKFYISTNSINLYVDLTDDALADFYNYYDIDYLLAYTTNAFEVSYTDVAASSSQYCLYVKKYGQYSNEVVNSSCSSSAAGSLSVGFTPENITYFALFTANINSEERTVATAWKDFLSDELNAGAFGIFLTILLVGVFVMLTQIHLLAAIMGAMALVFAKLLGILSLGWGNVITIVIAAIILTFILELKK